MRRGERTQHGSFYGAGADRAHSHSILEVRGNLAVDASKSRPGLNHGAVLSFLLETRLTGDRVSVS